MNPKQASVNSRPYSLNIWCSQREEFDIKCMRRLVMDKPVERDLKKPYSKPLFTVYGTVRELTQMVGRGGHPDGGRGARANKTHV